VLELDFLKRCDRTNDCHHEMRFLALMPQKCVSVHASALDPAGGAYSTPPDPLAEFEEAALSAYAYKSAGLL